VISVLTVVVASLIVVALRVEEVALRVHKAPVIINVEALLVVDTACWVSLLFLTTLVTSPSGILGAMMGL